MITYLFTSQNFLGQTIKIQYSKYSSNTRIDLGSGTFPFQYTTDQLGGTYYFYIPSIDRTFPKTIDIPPIDIYTEEINVPDCDLSGVTIFVPPCDIDYGIIEVPVCDIDYEVTNVTPTPTLTFTSTSTITPTPSITESVTPTPTVTPTNTPTPSITESVTPTVTPTNTNTPTVTPTNTNTPTVTTSQNNKITIIGTFNVTNNPYSISSENINSRYYVYGPNGTEILDSLYKSIGNLSFSAFSGNSIAKVLFDSSNSKLYFGSLGNEFIDVYDLIGESSSQIDLSIYNDSVWDMTIDINNNILGVINGGQFESGRIIFVNTLSDTVFGEFTGNTGGYRGAITNDFEGYMGVVSSNEDLLKTYNSTIPLSALTIPISANTGGYRSVIHNQTNGYYYVLNFGHSLEWIDPIVGSLGSLNLTGYSGSNINSVMVYNSSNDRIYILNCQSNGSYGVITVDCSKNTILDFTNNLFTGGGIGPYEGGLYLDTLVSSNELLIWTKTNKTVNRLSIP